MYKFKECVGYIKDVDRKSRVITGFLTGYGNKDYDGDIAYEGAFQKTLLERGPKGRNEIFFLNQHKWAEPHGKFKILEERKAGLYFESNKMPNTTYSNDAIELYAEEIVKEHSYGYEVMRSTHDKEKDARILQEVKLYEGSNVTLGANPNTPFTGFKNLSIEEINDRTKSIVQMLRNGTLTDDTFLLLEIALKQLQAESFELGKKEITQTPSITDTSAPIIDILKEFNKKFILT